MPCDGIKPTCSFQPPMETGVSVERALELAGAVSIPMATEEVSLDEAHGRVLADPLCALADDPRFDNSAMDGWAVRASDCAGGGIRLRVVGTGQAGGAAAPEVCSGEAARVMTGAAIPEGADAIVMVEDSEVDGDEVLITGPARPHYIRIRGENLEKGEEGLPAGVELTPPRLALAGTMGHATVPVIVPPKVAVISTGDELVPPGEPLGEHDLWESNTHALAGLCHRLGCQPVRFPLVIDELDALRAALTRAAEECDVIITSGGVSMGDWDLVRRLMETEGDVRFWRVHIRPGGPPLFGLWNGTPLFGLPGNPVSAYVVFLMLVAPWLALNLGHHPEDGPKLADRVRVRLLDEVKGAPGKLALKRIHITTEGDELVARVRTHQGSGNLASLVAGNGLTLLPAGSGGEPGDIIDALWLR